MGLDQHEHAVGHQVTSGSLEGMDHALDTHSSKRPTEKDDVERVAADSKVFG